MSDPLVTPELALEHGLSIDEYEQVLVFMLLSTIYFSMMLPHEEEH